MTNTVNTQAVLKAALTQALNMADGVDGRAYRFDEVNGAELSLASPSVRLALKPIEEICLAWMDEQGESLAGFVKAHGGESLAGFAIASYEVALPMIVLDGKGDALTVTIEGAEADSSFA